MRPARTLASLFEEAPSTWRLRGDPHLWREMQAILGNSAYPDSEAQLTALLEQTYQQLTGAPLTNPEPIFVERYSHGGISSGYVASQYWAETVIPLLRARYRDTA